MILERSLLIEKSAERLRALLEDDLLLYREAADVGLEEEIAVELFSGRA